MLGCSESFGGEDLDKCVLPSRGCVRDLGTSALVCPRLWEKEGLELHSGNPVDSSAVDTYPRRGRVAPFPPTLMGC